MNMKLNNSSIGIDRVIQMEWLVKTASLVLDGNDNTIIKNILMDDIKGHFRSKEVSSRGAIDKTITILMRTWIGSNKELKPLREDGMELIKRYSRTHHVLVHWGMIASTYPFWQCVAMQTGRLLRLQGTAAASQIQRRIREQFGQRETVSLATSRVLRSFLNWGVITETETKGVYSAGTTLEVSDHKLIAWLLEASLYGVTDKVSPLKDLINSPSLFPFQIKPINAEILVSASSRLDYLRHGMDEDLLMLRNNSTK